MLKHKVQFAKKYEKLQIKIFADFDLIISNTHVLCFEQKEQIKTFQMIPYLKKLIHDFV